MWSAAETGRFARADRRADDAARRSESGGGRVERRRDRVVVRADVGLGDGARRLCSSIQFAQFSPSGRYLAVIDDQRNIIIFDATNGDPIGSGTRLTARASSIEFSPAEDKVVVAAGNWTDEYGYARIIDVKSGKAVGKRLAHRNRVAYASLSRRHEGRHCFVGLDRAGGRSER